MANDRNVIKEQMEIVNDCMGRWNPLFDTMKEDYEMRLGKQWKDDEAQRLANKGRPALVMNHIDKQCNLIAGHQRQNTTDIKVFPVEDDDEYTAQMLTEAIKWTMNNCGANYIASLAFDDAVTGGIGWLAPTMDFNRDMLNGDIILKRVSPFRMMIDYNFEDPQLTDAQYMIYFNYLPKKLAELQFPDVAEEIRGMTAGETFGRMAPIGDMKGKVLVTERWYRTYEKRKFIVNLTTSDVLEVSDYDPAELQQLLQKGYQNGFEYTDIERNVAVIKGVTCINNKVIAEEKDNPISENVYPYIPIFNTFSPSYNDLKYRIQGVVRNLKDPQREKNKTRSQIMNMIKTMPYGKIAFEKGSVDNPQAFINNNDANEVIEVNPGKQFPQQIQASAFPSALFQLEQSHDEEMRQIGVNPDLLGMKQDAGDAGVTIQLRQKQGITALQPFFDNFSQSKRQLGNYFVALMVKHYTPEKFLRVSGMQPEPNWEERKNNLAFDCYIDETSENSTYKMANFLMLKQMQQQGMQIPLEMMIMTSPMSKTDKEQLLQQLQAQSQQPDPVQEAQIQELNAKVEKMAAEIDKLNSESLKIQAETMMMPTGAAVVQNEMNQQAAMAEQQMQEQQAQQAQMMAQQGQAPDEMQEIQ